MMHVVNASQASFKLSRPTSCSLALPRHGVSSLKTTTRHRSVHAAAQDEHKEVSVSSRLSWPLTLARVFAASSHLDGAVDAFVNLSCFVKVLIVGAQCLCQAFQFASHTFRARSSVAAAELSESSNVCMVL